jgi:hypothetical protein
MRQMCQFDTWREKGRDFLQYYNSDDWSTGEYSVQVGFYPVIISVTDVNKVQRSQS